MWQTLVVGPLEAALVFLADTFGSAGIPYRWGLAIIAFTLLIKIITIPLSISQVRSSKKMQDMQPQLKALQKKYAGNKEKLSQEQMKLYKEAGVNPLGGCLPSLIQLPVWIGLYQALLGLAHKNLLTGGFLWISDLTFPNTTVGTKWIWPATASNPYWGNGQGWLGVISYLILPVLTVITQIITQKLTTPPSTDETQSAMSGAMMIMPFMFGFFALTFPSGLALYWVTNNLFTMIQQYLLVGKPAPAASTAAAGASSLAAGPGAGEAARQRESEPEPELVESSEPSPRRVPRQMPKKRARDGSRKRRRS
jgi:YidC/Oxa1 family membrane protein insertase